MEEIFHMLLQLVLTTATLVSDLILAAYKAAIFFIIIGIGWVVGRVVGSLIGKLVRRAGGDSLLRQTVIGRALMRSGYNSFELARSLTKWLIYLSAVLVALDSLALPILTVSVTAFLTYLPVLVGSFIILVVGIILSDWAGEFVKKSTTPEKRDLFYMNYVGDIVKVVLYFVTITLALTHLGVDVTILYIFANAFAWAVAIAVGVAVGIIVGWLLKDRILEFLRTLGLEKSEEQPKNQ
jgi:small-conductance mechanosensitive channel